MYDTFLQSLLGGSPSTLSYSSVGWIKLSMESWKPFGNIAERNGRIDGQMKSKAQLQQGFWRVFCSCSFSAGWTCRNCHAATVNVPLFLI